jgi:hypothetical protein
LNKDVRCGEFVDQCVLRNRAPVRLRQQVVQPLDLADQGIPVHRPSI